MKTAPVSDMNRRAGDVLELVKQGPVALMSRSDPAAIMVSPEQWNQMAEELRQYRVIAEAKKIYARTEAEGTWVSEAELLEDLAKRDTHVAP